MSVTTEKGKTAAMPTGCAVSRAKLARVAKKFTTETMKNSRTESPTLRKTPDFREYAAIFDVWHRACNEARRPKAGREKMSATDFSFLAEPFPSEFGATQKEHDMTTLIPWSRTQSPFNRLRNELDEMFDRFRNEPFFENSIGMKVWEPRVDIEETDKEITVKADLPGVDSKDIDVQVVDGVLTIKGERKEEKEEKKKNYHRVERFVGSFYRAIPLPAGADADKVAAMSAKGVITVSIPKKPELQPKKIAVKSQD